MKKDILNTNLKPDLLLFTSFYIIYWNMKLQTFTRNKGVSKEQKIKKNALALIFKDEYFAS